jgi:hypothetical protein
MSSDDKHLPENEEPFRDQKGTDRPLAKRLAGIVRELHANAAPDGHEMSKEEIDEMWGHP